MYQTFKRKRAIADRGGAQAKYLEKVVAPDKSNSPLGVVAISPDPQNTPTLADSSPTTLVISDAPTQQTPTAANSMIMPVDIAPALRCKTPIPAKSTPNPVAKSLFEPERAPIAANRTPVPFLPSLEDEAYVVVRNFVCIFPSWKDYTADTEQFPVFLRNLRVSNVLMLFMVITAYVSADRRHKISFFQIGKDQTGLSRRARVGCAFQALVDEVSFLPEASALRWQASKRNFCKVSGATFIRR